MNGNNKNYSIRRLTAEECEFAADRKNYNYLFFYMRKWQLDEEWYDLLIEPYLNAVKKYHEYESARKYAFSTVLKNMLWTAVTNELKKRKAKKRMPEGGFVSLDYMVEGDNPFSEHHTEEVETWWIDKNINVEKQVILKELFREFYKKVENELFFGEDDKWLLDCLLEGYEMRELIKMYEDKYGKCDPDDWMETRDFIDYDLKRIRRNFKDVFGI